MQLNYSSPVLLELQRRWVAAQPIPGQDEGTHTLGQLFVQNLNNGLSHLEDLWAGRQTPLEKEQGTPILSPLERHQLACNVAIAQGLPSDLVLVAAAKLSNQLRHAKSGEGALGALSLAAGYASQRGDLAETYFGAGQLAEEIALGARYGFFGTEGQSWRDVVAFGAANAALDLYKLAAATGEEIFVQQDLVNQLLRMYGVRSTIIGDALEFRDFTLPQELDKSFGTFKAKVLKPLSFVGRPSLIEYVESAAGLSSSRQELGKSSLDDARSELIGREKQGDKPNFFLATARCQYAIALSRNGKHDYAAEFFDQARFTAVQAGLKQEIPVYSFYAAEGLWRARAPAAAIAPHLDLVIADAITGHRQWSPGVIKTLASRVQRVAEYVGITRFADAELVNYPTELAPLYAGK
ncbi:hypothetical protein HYV86_04625 [Candidatus Woesearchaeota archaeon]|nr:hypothetical protein [Candidatus Woesearchaeota archaeon]